VREKFFGLLLELREHHVFIVATLAASLVSAATFLPYYPLIVDANAQALPQTIGVRVASLILIPVLAAADKIADWQAKKDAKATLASEATKAQQTYQHSISSLLLIANRGADIAHETPGKRKAQLKDLRTVLVTATHGLSNAAQTRATYYTLNITPKGRILSEPVSHGRVEESTTIWEESKDPKHSVWGIMDGEDVNAPIVRSTDADRTDWADWNEKKYKSFISVPVKAHGVQFGMLSLNAPNSEDLTETDRMAVLVAARIMATTLSLALDTNQLKELGDNLVKLRARQAISASAVSVPKETERDSVGSSALAQ
jgi:GAF domain-containing protein